MKLISYLAVFCWAVAAGGPGYAQAPAYPAKPVRIVVPFPPGGINDVVTRLIAPRLSESTGQSFVIENRGGATGTIGAAVVAKAAPDGYTLLSVGSATASVAPHLYASLPYDQLRDFAPIGRIASIASIVLVHPSLPANSMAELISLIKSKPGAITFGSGGAGGSQHVGAELLRSLIGVQMTHVPYKGGGPAMIDLLAGQVSMMIEPMPTALPQLRSGKLRGLAITTLARSATLPDLPTVDESGVPGFDFTIWLGLFAPAGTPPEIIGTLNRELGTVLRAPAMRERLSQQGADPVTDSPEEFAAYARGDFQRWGQVVRASGMKLE